MKSKNLFYLFAVAAFCVVMVGCEKPKLPDKPKLSEYQEILFKVEYVNAFLVPRRSALFIDKNGNIKTYSYVDYSNQNTEGWNFPDREGFISEEKMNENLEKTELSDKKIDLETLQKYATKILYVKYDDYTERHEGYDMGIGTNSCYLFDEDTKMYREIILSQYGSWTKTNNHSVAKEIDSWLKTISYMIY